jgi:release factor glutamine methyltransferase
VLDVCTGSGAIAVAAALAGARSVTAVNLSRPAVIAARLDARLNGQRRPAHANVAE